MYMRGHKPSLLFHRWRISVNRTEGKKVLTKISKFFKPNIYFAPRNALTLGIHGIPDQSFSQSKLIQKIYFFLVKNTKNSGKEVFLEGSQLLTLEKDFSTLYFEVLEIAYHCNMYSNFCFRI